LKIQVTAVGSLPAALASFSCAPFLSVPISLPNWVRSTYPPACDMNLQRGTPDALEREGDREIEAAREAGAST
jgi:hypothetical protein